MPSHRASPITRRATSSISRLSRCRKHARRTTNHSRSSSAWPTGSARRREKSGGRTIAPRGMAPGLWYAAGSKRGRPAHPATSKADDDASTWRQREAFELRAFRTERTRDALVVRVELEDAVHVTETEPETDEPAAVPPPELERVGRSGIGRELLESTARSPP